MQNKIQILYQNAEGKVWCPWCRKVHHHSIEKEEKGHRSAHCNSDSYSPYGKQGYYIEYNPTKYNELKNKYPFSKEAYQRRYKLIKNIEKRLATTPFFSKVEFEQQLIKIWANEIEELRE